MPRGRLRLRALAAEERAREEHMGTWGTGIFDDDTALDVRDEYLDAIAEGEDDATVTARMIRAWAAGDAYDPDETPCSGSRSPPRSTSTAGCSPT